MSSALLFQEKNRLAKFFFCLIIGMILTHFLGYTNAITISVTSLLVISSDRGEAGSKLYMKRRFGTNILMAIMAVLSVWLISVIFPVAEWVQVIIATVVVVSFGLFIDAKFQIAPMPVTVATASLIIITGLLSSPSYPLRRILLVAIGCALGYISDFFLFPSHPLKATASICQQVDQLLKKNTPHLSTLPDLLPNPAFFSNMEKLLTTAQTNLSLVKSNLTHKKYASKKVQILRLEAFLQVQRSHVELHRFLSENQASFITEPSSFTEAFALEWKKQSIYAKNLSEAILHNQTFENPTEVFLPVTNNNQVLLLSKLLAYSTAIHQLHAVA